MTTISQIENAVIAQLATLTDLNPYAFLPDNFTTPCAIVGVGEVDYHSTFGLGISEYHVPVLIVVARSSDIAAQQALDAYRSRNGTNSIPALIDSDKTLGGVVATSELQKSSPHVAISINGAEYIAVEFTLLVYV
jgi:hypothetical protein